jgi:hypothetical protein
MKKDIRWKINKHDIPTYNVWVGMKSRCYNKNSLKYPSYGARGIKVCDRWKEFNNFYDDMFIGYKKGLTLDRINNNGNYEIENCRWTIPKVQANNTRRNKYIEHNGIKNTLTEWSKILGVSHSFLQRRIKLGWNTYDVLYKPHRYKTN